MKHFVETVGHTVAIFGADCNCVVIFAVGNKIGGDERKQLFVVTVFYEFHDRCDNVSIIALLQRFGTEVINSEHRAVFDFLKAVGVGG